MPIVMQSLFKDRAIAPQRRLGDTFGRPSILAAQRVGDTILVTESGTEGVTEFPLDLTVI